MIVDWRFYKAGLFKLFKNCYLLLFESILLIHLIQLTGKFNNEHSHEFPHAAEDILHEVDRLTKKGRFLLLALGLSMSAGDPWEDVPIFVIRAIMVAILSCSSCKALTNKREKQNYDDDDLYYLFVHLIIVLNWFIMVINCTYFWNV